MLVQHSTATQTRRQLSPVKEIVHFIPESFLGKVRKSEGQREPREKKETVEVQKDQSPLVCWETLEVSCVQSNFFSRCEISHVSQHRQNTPFSAFKEFPRPKMKLFIDVNPSSSLEISLLKCKSKARATA